MLQSETSDLDLITSNPDRAAELSDLPPFLKSWGQIYTIVVGELALLVLLFYLFSRAFR